MITFLIVLFLGALGAHGAGLLVAMAKRQDNQERARHEVCSDCFADEYLMPDCDTCEGTGVAPWMKERAWSS